MKPLLLWLVWTPLLGQVSPLELRHDEGEWTAEKLEGISDLVCLAKVTGLKQGERRSRNDHVPTVQMIATLEPVTVYRGEPRPKMEFRFWLPDPEADRESPWPDHVDVRNGQQYIFYLKDNTEYYYPALQGKFDDGASVRQPAAAAKKYKMDWDF